MARFKSKIYVGFTFFFFLYFLKKKLYFGTPVELTLKYAVIIFYSSAVQQKPMNINLHVCWNCLFTIVSTQFIKLKHDLLHKINKSIQEKSFYKLDDCYLCEVCLHLFKLWTPCDVFKLEENELLYYKIKFSRQKLFWK